MLAVDVFGESKQVLGQVQNDVVVAERGLEDLLHLDG